MGLLSDDIRKRATLKLTTAKVKQKKGRVLILLERLLEKSAHINQKRVKKGQSLMESRRLVWAQYSKRKKEFEVEAYDFLEGDSYDVVMCHDSKAMGLAIKLARRHKALLGFDLVEMTFAKLRGFKPSYFTRRALARKEKKIAKAPFIISGDPYLSKDFKARNPRTDPVLMLNGQEANIPPILRPLRRRLEDKTHRPIVLFIGLIAPHRGIQQIVDAFAKVRTDALLALVGPGNPDFKAEIEDQIQRLNLSERVWILDGVPQRDVVPLARTATIGVSPISTKLGNAGLVLNNRLFQYIAAGLPILSPDVPGPGGFIKEHGIGYIYDGDDIDDLAFKIDIALSDIVENKTIRANIKQIAGKYTWESQKEILLSHLKAVEKTYEIDKKVHVRRKRETKSKKEAEMEQKEKSRKHAEAITPQKPSFKARINRYIRTILRVPENHRQSALSETIIRRTHMLNNQLNNVKKQSLNIKNTLNKVQNEKRSLTPKEVSRLLSVNNMLVNSTEAQAKIIAVVEENAVAVGNLQTIGKAAPKNQAYDKLFETTDYPEIDNAQSPYVLRRRNQMKVLLLNSVGGSMGRLSKSLLSQQNIDCDCFVASYLPRRQLFYAHETNANGVFSHDEWRDFLNWAVNNYDIIQSSTFPLHKGVAACYDWLTDTIGHRHLWRTTGFIHHYIHREDILPSYVYQSDLNVDSMPNPEKYSGKTFSIKGDHMETGDHTIFYSSPEKGVYFKGKNKVWLTSMRDPEQYKALKDYRIPNKDTSVKIYVPYHKQAVFKGLNIILSILEDMKGDGANIDVITPENATQFWPDLLDFRDSEAAGGKPSIYPIPNHMMPKLLGRVDIVIDQIIMGCYGNTAIEAMLCEKPVIAQKRYKEYEGCPVIEADAATLRSVLENLLEDRSSWKKLGEQGRQYALEKHSPRVISKIAADTYTRVLSQYM